MNGDEDSNQKKQDARPSAGKSEATASPQNQPVEKTGKKENPDGKKRDFSSMRVLGFPLLDFLQSAFDLTLAITAIVGSVFIYRQLDLTQQQIAAAQDAGIGQQRATNRALAIADSQAKSMGLLAESTHSNERARLFVQNVFLSSPAMAPRVGDLMRVSLEIANSGRSAAQHLSSNLVFEALPKGRTPRTMGHPFSGDYTVPPNAGGAGVDIAIDLKRDGRSVGPLSQQTIDALKGGKIVPFLYGRLNYYDIFGALHWLDVCRVWKADEINAFTGARGGWRDCTKGATEDEQSRQPVTPAANIPTHR